MSENNRDELADETRTDRRSILKSLGAMGLAVPGGESAGLGDTVADRLPADPISRQGTVESDLLDLGQGWLLRHADYTAEPWEPEPHDPRYDPDPDHDVVYATAQTQHSIRYLDVQWQDYGSPVGSGGCWKHTFFLTSFASTTAIGYESDPEDGVDHTDLEAGDAQTFPEIWSSAVEVDTDERGDGSNDYGDLPYGWPNSENLGVGVRRDEEMLGFLDDVFAADEDIKVDFVQEDGSEVTLNLLQLLAKPPVDASGDGDRPLDEPPTQDGEDIEMNWGSIAQPFFDTPVFGLGISIVAIAAGTVCAACAFGIWLVGNALPLLTREKWDPEVDFDQGVRLEWSPGTGDSVPFTGHYMMFDVFVPPADPGREDPMGTFTVQSQYDVAGFPGPGSDLTEEYFAFNPRPRWEFRVGGLPHPDELGDDPGDERFTIMPRRDTESDVTNVIAEPVDFDTVLPDAVFSYEPFCPEPGDPIYFDATASWSTDDAEYEWTLGTALDGEPEVTETGETFELEDGLEEGWYGVRLRIEDEGAGTADDMRQWISVGTHDPGECVAGPDGVTVESDIQQTVTNWENNEPIQGTGKEVTETETLQRINAEFNETHDLYRDGTPWGVQ